MQRLFSAMDTSQDGMASSPSFICFSSMVHSEHARQVVAEEQLFYDRCDWLLQCAVLWCVFLNHQVTLDEFAQLIESPKLRFWMSQLDSWTASCAELRLCLCRGFLVRRTAA